MTNINNIEYSAVQHVEYAKFIQNLLLENNIKCYLIGGSLINALRDNGKLISYDIDFAIINYDDDIINDILKLLEKSSLFFSWETGVGMLCVYLEYNIKYKIDLFLFVKRHVNFYIPKMVWLHERVSSFQTFKQEKVTLENKELITMFRPDLFLTTVYGDWSKPTDEYISKQAGNTDHLKECVFYIDENNYNKIDFQLENLKIIFKSVIVRRNIINIDAKKINIFDDIYLNFFPREKTLFYNDFIKFFIKEDIKYFDV
jgi:hypothetical protein